MINLGLILHHTIRNEKPNSSIKFEYGNNKNTIVNTIICRCNILWLLIIHLMKKTKSHPIDSSYSDTHSVRNALLSKNQLHPDRGGMDI